MNWHRKNDIKAPALLGRCTDNKIIHSGPPFGGERLNLSPDPPVMPGSRIPLDPVWLASRKFRFYATPDGREIAAALRFAANGRILGYSHPNEVAWRIDNGRLLIIREDGSLSCIAEPRQNADGSISLVGPWLDRPNTIHNFHEIIAGSMLPVVQTFDLFDTLIARRCVHPHEVFHAVELKAAHPGFAKMRIEAEAAIYQGPEYSLDDIYREMVKSFELSDAEVPQLKALELAEEFDNLIPIQEHIVEVNPGDIIVTDIYLPKAFITSVVREKCGLHFNPIYVSSHGKSRGRAWDLLKRTCEIRNHTGDNEHSDIRMAAQHGIKGSLTTLSRMTSTEILVQELGYRGLARAMREARLGLWNSDEAKLKLGRAQIEANFPLLFLAALLLIDLASRKHWRHILFSSRDCYLFFRLFQRLASRLGLALESTYFFTSRIARAVPSASYINYFTRLCDVGSTVVVDICGTGWSLTRLFEAAGRPETEMFLIHHMDLPDLMQHYRTIAAIQQTPTVNYLTRNGNNGLLESFNTADHRMVTDVIEVDRLSIPIFLDQTPSVRYTELVRYSIDAFEAALVATESIHKNEIVHAISIVEPSHVERIYHAMDAFMAAVPDISNQIGSENESTLKLIQARLVFGE
jgi:antitoxin component HigA of HigAB toxin-antitoxin module